MGEDKNDSSDSVLTEESASIIKHVGMGWWVGLSLMQNAPSFALCRNRMNSSTYNWDSRVLPTKL